METFLSSLEREVYKYIEVEKKVSFDKIKAKFGIKGEGAIGKLKQSNLVEIERNWRPEIHKAVKIIKIREVK